MRIGIDARFYGGSYGKGLGRYCEKLITHLEKVDHENEYVIFLRSENWDAYTPANPRFTKVRADVRWYSLAEQLLMPWYFYRAKLHLLHVPHFNVPFLYRKKFVVTIHDLIILRFPTERATTLGPFLYALKNAAFRFIIHSSVDRAKRIIAVSHFTRKDIASYFHVKEKDITVIYEAVEAVATAQDDSVLGRNYIPETYFLYVGNAYPHKNLERFLRAFKDFSARHTDYYAVLVGKEEFFYKRLQTVAQKLGLLETGKERVRFVGWVSDAALRGLYEHAAAFVFPSLYEGFGFPPLEAMQFDVPVLASNASCLPEILEDAALYFDPHSEEDMVKKFDMFMGLEKDEKKRYTMKGREQVAKYSWDRCARETKAIYELEDA